MLSAMFLHLLVADQTTDPEAPVEPPVAIAQRAAAEALEAQGLFTEAGNAYVKLADLPGVDRRRALDSAHMSYDSAYLTTRSPSRLCWALRVAERVVHEGGFRDADQASYWQDTVADDLRRLEADARATGRANCRFEATGAPRALVVTVLTDDDFAGQDPSPHQADTAATANAGRTRVRSPATRRWRAQTAAGGLLTGTGIGFAVILAGVLEVQAQHARALRRMTATVRTAGRGFTEDEWQVYNTIRDDGLKVRAVAIGVGVAGAVTLSAGVALLATRGLVSRKFALLPHAGPLGGGATLRLRF